MSPQELKRTFNNLLNRDPSPFDTTVHLHKTVNKLTEEILSCKEYKDRGGNRITEKRENYTNSNEGPKIAFLLSGHIRNNHILQSLTEKCKDLNYDIFIHTWDTKGTKGTEMNLDIKDDKYAVEEEIMRFCNVRSYEIENNAEYIEKIKGDDDNVSYFNYSSPEKFIKSQLYSINKCFKIFEKYSKKENIKYDIVFRIRFDLGFDSIEIDRNLINEINEYDIIFCPNVDGPHSHPDHGTSCKVCDDMYYKWKFRYPHVFEHSNVICDVFAYGSVKSMKDYCSLYENYDKIAKKFEKENLKSLNRQRNPNVKKSGKDYLIKDHCESLFYYYGSYPERMLSYYLRDYMLVESRKIKLNKTLR